MKLFRTCALLVFLLVIVLTVGYFYFRRNHQEQISQFESQFGQDKWIINEIFPYVTNGYYVEVGSADGEDLSNTKKLDDIGWNGLCIDPFPQNMDKRTCNVVKVAVSDREGTEQFVKAGILGGFESNLNRYANDVKNSEKEEVRTETLENILNAYNAPAFIHYLSLDTEGSEYRILKSFPFHKYQFGAITVEHNFEEPKRSQIRNLLRENGYIFVKSVSVDDWYILDKRFARVNTVMLM